MAKRYLVRGPRVFGLLHKAEIVLRKASTPKLRLAPAPGHRAPAAASSAESVRLARFERPVPTLMPRAVTTASSSESARPAHAGREDRAVSAST
jgi:hypothetical protein